VKTAELIVIGGAVLIGGYFVYQATSQSTDIQASACSGDWTDAINPVCWLSALSAETANAANAATNELNVVLIILAVVIVLVIALLAFGPGTEHIGRAAAAFV
jgi:hypothetical protein